MTSGTPHPPGVFNPGCVLALLWVWLTHTTLLSAASRIGLAALNWLPALSLGVAFLAQCVILFPWFASVLWAVSGLPLWAYVCLSFFPSWAFRFLLTPLYHVLRLLPLLLFSWLRLAYWRAIATPGLPVGPRPSGKGHCWTRYRRLGTGLTDRAPTFNHCRRGAFTLGLISLALSLCPWLPFDGPFLTPAFISNREAAALGGLLPVTRVRRGIYHLGPHPRARLMRASRLPVGWYGTLDADYFAGTPLHFPALSKSMKEWDTHFREAREQCPNAVDPRQEHYLRAAGIRSPVPGAPPHAHPLHVAFERKSLFIAARLLPARWSALWLRSDKQAQMQRHGAAAPLEVFNPRLEAKDIARFAADPLPPTGRGDPTIHAAFMHDVLQLMSPAAVGRIFDSNRHLDYLVATAVIPPETAFGLPALTPNLYNFAVDGKTLLYVPEGDQGGAYSQPADACRWLRATKLVTPQSECIHVHLVHTSHAHHVFVLSRRQLLPQDLRVLDMPPLVEIPVLFHPFASRYERLTEPGLANALVNYATRVSATNLRDLYAKVASYRSEVTGNFPASYVRAAVLNAVHTRALDFHAGLGTFSRLWFWLSLLLRLPLLPLPWLYQSWTSTHFATGYDRALIWRLRTGVLVSSRRDAPFPGTRDLCGPDDLGLWYLPPGATKLAHCARASAQLSIAVGMKIAFPGLVRLLVLARPFFFPALDALKYYIGWDPVYTPLGIAGFLLAFWYGLPGPRVQVSLRWFQPRAWLSFCLAWLFGLPIVRRPGPAGVSWPYLVALDSALFFSAVPRLLLFVVRYDQLTLAVSAFWFFWFVVGFCRFPFGPQRLRPRLPTHRHTAMGLEAAYPHAGAPPPPPPPPPPPSAPPSAPDSPDASEFGDFHSSLPEVEEPEDLAPAPAPRPAPGLDAPPAPRGPPPPAPGLDPLWRYALDPALFDSAAQFSDWVRTLPDLPFLEPGDSCVWQCLSAAFGCPAELLHAVFCASLPGPARRDFAAGLVPAVEIDAVLRFFRVGGNIFPAAAAPVERRPGMPQPLPRADPQHPPWWTRPAVEFWPYVNWFLASEADHPELFHLCLAAQYDDMGPQLRMPLPDALIGYISRSVPLAEIAAVVNFTGNFMRTLSQLTGARQNSVRLACPSLAGVVVANSAFAPLPDVPVSAQVLDYELTAEDLRLATSLATDMKAFPATMELRDLDAHNVAACLEASVKRALPGSRVRLHLYHGAAGTGKSYAMVRDLAAVHARTPFTADTLRFHTWRNSLRGALKADVQDRFWDADGNSIFNNYSFSTKAMPLVQPLGGTVVFDDASVLWPGYLPLLAATNPGITDIYCSFDAAQCRATFPEADSLSRQEISTAEWLAARSDRYGTRQHRLAPRVARLLGFTPGVLPGRAPSAGRIYLCSRAPADVPLLVVSPRFAETQNSGGQRCLTFADCQGLTIHGDVAVDLGGLTGTATENAVYTALTRATGHVFLVLGSGLSPPRLREEGSFAKSTILSAIVSLAANRQTAEITPDIDPGCIVRDACYSHVSRCLSPAARASLGLPAPNPLVAGHVPAAARQRWLDAPPDDFFGDYWTARADRATYWRQRSSGALAFDRHTPVLGTSREFVADALRHVAAVPNDAVLAAPSLGYSLPPAPVFSVQPDPALMKGRFVADELREWVNPANALQSMQHVHDADHAVVHHTRADRLTVTRSEQKRIRVGQDHARLSPSERARLEQLKRGFKKFFDVSKLHKSGFDAAAFDSATRRSLAPWVSKRTRAAVARSTAANDLDQAYTQASLFLKGQYVKKEEKRYTPAVAGQIVSSFALGKQFRDAPFALYLEDMLFRCKYASTYLHARASPADMEAWYSEFWVPGAEMTANDYTAWDGGCDRVFANFDAWLLKLVGLPAGYIETYVFEKTHTRSYLGPHMCRQESGDRWTWILNTARNAAITGASLNVPRATPAAFSGDDGVVLGRRANQDGFHGREWLMTPKREISRKVVFCGFVFGPPHLAPGSGVVLHRAQFGIALGRNDPDYWRSISDAIRESAPAASDTDVELATAAAAVHAAERRFNFRL
nr:MAG: polyprotein [Sichuan deltaflexi-like virus 3]